MIFLLHPLRTALRLVLVFAIFSIAGCASSIRATDGFDTKSTQWQGRLALKVQSAPPQAFSAYFDLQGNADAGTLTLSTVLGSTLARMQWAPGSAELRTTGEPTRFASLPALIRHVTGTDLPISSLFDWLQGRATDEPGWDVDFSNLAQDRLSARRTSPQGDTELKIILER